jgi:hypothetical protein
VQRMTLPTAVILLAGLNLLIGARGRPHVAMIAVRRASAVGALCALRLLSSPDARASLAIAVLAIAVLIAVSVLSTISVPGPVVGAVGSLGSLRVVSAVRGLSARAVLSLL